MVSYFNDSELEKAKEVSDKELNELFQEVRQKDSKFYLLERKITTKKWFKKPIEKIYYILLYHTYSCECQIINFCQDHEGSINGMVSKSYIYTMFCGFLNGYKSALNIQFETLSQDYVNICVQESLKANNNDLSNDKIDFIKKDANDNLKKMQDEFGIEHVIRFLTSRLQ